MKTLEDHRDYALRGIDLGKEKDVIRTVFLEELKAVRYETLEEAAKEAESFREHGDERTYREALCQNIAESIRALHDAKEKV